MNILLTSSFSDKALRRIEEEVAGMSLLSVNKDKLSDSSFPAAEIEAFIGSRAPVEFLKRAVDLKYYIIPFAGIPEMDRKNLSEFPEIKILNSHFNSFITAEHAWALLLSLTKQVPVFHNDLRKGDWSRRFHEDWNSVTLSGKNLLILGYGHIGRAVGSIARAFSMNVKAVARMDKEYDGNVACFGHSSLPDLLPEADFIICCLPATNATKGLLGINEFLLVKRSVYLVNVGRGDTICEDSLYSALKEKRIGGIAIDTWWNYPESEEGRSCTFPSEHPLQEFDNVIFSPHRASHVEDSEELRISELIRILRSVMDNNPVNIVDIERGY